MLVITVNESFLFNETKSEFVHIPTYKLQLEHSLISIAKWESKWHKPFLSQKVMTAEENLDYIRCMTISKNVPEEVYYGLNEENVREINAYIANPMTATTFPKTNDRPSREIVTAEIIYYWMIANNIPPEYEKWHLNRLLTLIRVCNAKNAPSKKKSKTATAKEFSALNKARLAKRGGRE